MIEINLSRWKMHLKYLRHFSEAKQKTSTNNACGLYTRGANVHLNTHARQILHDSEKNAYSHVKSFSFDSILARLFDSSCTSYAFAIGNCKRYFYSNTFVHCKWNFRCKSFDKGVQKWVINHIYVLWVYRLSFNASRLGEKPIKYLRI